MESAFKSKKDNSRKHPERDAARKKARVEAAKVRAELRASATPRQLLEALDVKFGPGKGAVKERARLAAQIVKLHSGTLIAPRSFAATDPIPEMTEAKRKKKAKERRAEEREGLRPWGGR